MLDFSCVSFYFIWKCSLSIPSRFSIGGDILAAPATPTLVECSTLQVIRPFYYFVLNFNDTNRLFLNVIAQRKVI